MNKKMNLIKKIGGTLLLPVFMYFAMMLLCYSHGKMYYGTWKMWQTLIVSTALSVTCAMGIGLQFKCGRFDFSGGAIMLVAATVSGNIAKMYDNNLILMVILCIAICIVLSLIVAVVYVYGRLPIIIATIGMALLYESITCLIFGGTGINIVSNMQLRKFYTFPDVLIPLIAAIAIYAFYSYLTVAGKQAVLLANNQSAAVNIGINEKRNVIISYFFSGLLFGIATVIYIASGIHNASFTSLSTVNELFNNILPVFIGLIIARFCGDTIGIIMGSITLCLMSYSLAAVFNSAMGSAISTICTGIFVLAINVVSSQGIKVIQKIRLCLFKKQVV